MIEQIKVTVDIEDRADRAEVRVDIGDRGDGGDRGEG